MFSHFEATDELARCKIINHVYNRDGHRRGGGEPRVIGEGHTRGGCRSWRELEEEFEEERGRGK